MAAAPLSAIHPFSPDVLRDPGAFDRRLRAEAPVHRDPHTGIFLVSTWDRVREAARDWETFSSRFARAMGGGGATPPPEVEAPAREGWPLVDTMLTEDPPAHHRFRKLVNKAFLPKRVDALAPRAEGIAHALIDAFAADGRCELRARFAQPLPLTVIAEQLGVPREDLPTFRRFTEGFVAQLGGMADREGRAEAARLILAFQRYFAERLEARRRAPADDILSDLVHARVEDERPLDVAEMLSILQQILVAGNETTASAIVEGVALLIDHPDQMARVRAEPTRIPALVEEVLRLATPTANMWRVATRDTELGGVAIPKGSMLMLRYASANRDEAVFPEPDRFDVARPNAGEHLAFGSGVHFCLGARLARMEMTVAFRVLLERLEDLAFDPERPRPRHVPNLLLHGLEALPLVFRPR
ncbi:MAG: cytochrome P450 [Myxococcota bacterium]|nr:cytochrome P450 [Myxococcota bacterium]